MSPGARMARDPYRRQIRHARRAMRKGDNPFQVIIAGPDVPLGLIALAVVSRWAWRHRTAFAPFGITIAAFAVAAFTHPHHARYWLPAAGITTLVTILLAMPHRFLNTPNSPRRRTPTPIRWPAWAARSRST
jgi:hypothetical protein